MAAPPPPPRLLLPARLYGLHPLHSCDVRLLAAHLNSLVASPEVRDSHFLYGTHPLTRAEVAGVVVRSAQVRERRLLLLDDGTGLAQASVFETNVDGSPSLLPRARVGDLVVVAGKLANWWRAGRAEDRCTEIRVRALRKLASLDELSSHQLRTMALHVRCYSQPLRVLMPGVPGLDAFTDARMLAGGGGGGGGMQLMARLPEEAPPAVAGGGGNNAFLAVAPGAAPGVAAGVGEPAGPAAALSERVAAVVRLLRAWHPWLRTAAASPAADAEPATLADDAAMLVDEPPPGGGAAGRQPPPSLELLPTHFTAGALHARLLVEEAAREGQFYTFSNDAEQGGGLEAGDDDEEPVPRHQQPGVQRPNADNSAEQPHEAQAIGGCDLAQEAAVEDEEEAEEEEEDADMRLTLQALGYLLRCGRLFLAASASPVRQLGAQLECSSSASGRRKRPRETAPSAVSPWTGGGGCGSNEDVAVGAGDLLGVLSVRHAVVPAVRALLATRPPSPGAAPQAPDRAAMGPGWAPAQLLAALRRDAATASVFPHALEAALAVLLEEAAVQQAPDGTFMAVPAQTGPLGRDTPSHAVAR